jgi:hypothetical protein
LRALSALPFASIALPREISPLIASFFELCLGEALVPGFFSEEAMVASGEGSPGEVDLEFHDIQLGRSGKCEQPD